VHRAYYSSVSDQPANEVWNLIRDFNHYPRYIEGVTESVIENDKEGDEVGAVRRFHYGDAWIRQRLIAHSDAERFFSYSGMEPFEFPDATPADAERWRKLLGGLIPQWVDSLRRTAAGER
jgi:Polyketide cyclase / dehydrase and lipid transport